MEELGPVGVVSLWLSHHHGQHGHTDGALQKPLTFVLLRLGLSDREHITTKLTVEIVDLLFQTKSAETFHALDANIHLLFDELSPAITLVVYIRSPKLGEPIHFKYYK